MTLPAWTICDSARLARELADRHLPGQRSKTAIVKLRRQRLHAAQQQPAPTLTQRVQARTVARYGREIRRRGGETTITTDRHGRTAALGVAHRGMGMVLLHAAGWRYYSARFGSRPASLSYLCGSDDAGDWAVRVPGTITTVHGGARLGRARRGRRGA